MDGSHPAVEASESSGQHERHEQDARSESEHVLGLAKIEAADPTDEHVPGRKVEQTP